MVKFGNPISAETMFDVVCATHLASYVLSPFPARSGLMLIGPPNALKTTFLSAVTQYPNAFPVSDLNSTQLTKIKSQISSQEIRTLILLDMQKLYERQAVTSSSIEGNLRALADEGFAGEFYDSNKRINRTLARGCVVGALTDEFFGMNADRWINTGFARRFLWGNIRLQDPEILAQAVIDWERLDFGTRVILPSIPPNGMIECRFSAEDRKRLYACVQFQYGKQSVPFQLLCKIAEVLRWHYERNGIQKDALEVVEEFASCLGRDCEPSSITGLYTAKSREMLTIKIDTHSSATFRETAKKVKARKLTEEKGAIAGNAAVNT